MKTSTKILLTSLGVLFLVILILALALRLYLAPKYIISDSIHEDNSKASKVIAIKISEHPNRVTSKTITQTITQTKPFKQTKQSTQIKNASKTAKFEHIKLNGIGQAYILQDNTASIKSNANPNAIMVSQFGDELTLSAPDSHFFQHKSIAVTIKTPSLKSLHVNGATDIQLKNFHEKKLNINLAGASSLSAVNNHIDHLHIKAAGASNINFLRSFVKNAYINFAGASHIRLNMTGGVLIGHLAGFSDIEYQGHVQKIEIEKAGLANISKIND